ncbi:MAG: DivIVA domain-containing protein [Actinomycetota bacterium]
MGKQDTAPGQGVTAADRALTALDIQQKEFRVSRFGGYKMRDVDEFLDQLTDAFSALANENERLRSGGAPVVGSPDLDDVSRQADEIIARARAEAVRITQEARGGAGAGVALTSSASAASQGNAGVSAFLTREREFLQSLAGLVQQHAEAVKGMAKTSRTAASTPTTSSAAAAPAAAGAPGKATPTARPAASGPEADERKAHERKADEAAPSPEPTSEAEPGSETEARSGAEVDERAGDVQAPTRVPDSEPTVRIEEPAAARTARSDGEPEGDGSLRELFWGED